MPGCSYEVILRSVSVVTVGRSDYGIFLPILRGLSEHPDLELRIIATVAHLSPEFGSTVNLIEEDGFEVSDRVDMLSGSDTPEGIATINDQLIKLLPT